MTPKQRVHAALRKEPADRVPVFMWFHPVTTRHLADLLEVRQEDVGEAMGNDVLMTWVNNNYAMEGIVHEHDGESHVDEWGIKWVKQGAFNQPAAFPLADADETAALDYAFPTDRMDALVSRMEPLLERGDEFFIGCDVSPCVFEMYWRLRGLDTALLDIALRPALAGTMFARCADFAETLSERACARFALDWLWTGDDVAGQTGLIMGPDVWRERIRPHLARVVAVGLRHGVPVAYHCCGALRPIIPDLIELGITVLNPVQSTCPGMDPLELKAEFGPELAFMGGVDTQNLLPNGSAAEVAAATARLLEGMTADGGGYILAASHTVPPETPGENIFAMYAEAGIPREEVFDRAADIRARYAPNGNAKK